MSEDIAREKQRWDQTTVRKSVERAAERRSQFATNSGIPVSRLYTPADVGSDYLRDVGFPGEYPFTRGVQPTMYRGRHWTMRQYAGFGTAEESNERYKYLLAQGQTGLSVAFDLPTQIGYDSDHPMAEGEVGKVGVAIDSLLDMEILLGGIPLDQVTTSMTINAPASVLLAMYVAVGAKQGVSPDKLGGTVQNDILKEYAARGTYIYPPKPSMRLITNIFAWCAREVPNWNTISISGYHIREAGSTAVQEVAFTLADGIAYVQAAMDAGLDVDTFGPRLSFFFNAHNDFLEEVAKFRAARRLWARIMRERFGAKNPRSWMLRFHTQTAGSMLTAQQPENNIVRVAVQALASILGGTQSLHTNSYDEALALPTEASVRIALRTQQVLAHESGVSETIDPLAGSYYVEHLTDQIEAQARAYIDQIDQLGGAVAAIEAGYMQREIQESAYRWQREVESGERAIVGVNAFRVDEPARQDILRLDPALVERQQQKVARVRSTRDAQAASERMAALEQAARGSDNLMPYILAAVQAYCTVGEICDAMRRVFGEYRPDESF